MIVLIENPSITISSLIWYNIAILFGQDHLTLIDMVVFKQYPLNNKEQWVVHDALRLEELWILLQNWLEIFLLPGWQFNKAGVLTNLNEIHVFHSLLLIKSLIPKLLVYRHFPVHCASFDVEHHFGVRFDLQLAGVLHYHDVHLIEIVTLDSENPVNSC
jgi:Na+/H+ antiporter NhaA